MADSRSPAGGRGAILGAIAAFRQQHIPIKLISSFLHANKRDGFDCPGCAFPDKPGPTLVDSCEQGQKAIAWEMTRKQTGAAFFAGKTPSELQQLSDHELEAHGRLTTPILFEQETGVFRAIDWPAAYTIIGRELNALPPAQAAFYASGRSSNEAAFLWQLAARSYGCANLPDSSNFCHEPSGFALKQVLGTGKGTCSLADFDAAELIIVMGQNPASNHPRMMVALHEAAQRGATVIAFNPLKERGFTHFSDPKDIGELIRNDGIAVAKHIHQVRIGGDLAALKGIIKAVFELAEHAERDGKASQVLDHDFINTHTNGIEALRADVRRCDWPTLCEQSGLSEAALRDVAQRYVQSNATMITWCMGITHHQHAVATIQHIINLLLLRGNIGKPGAGALPVRGHSNVQGDRTMGATSSVSSQFLDNLEAAFPHAEICRDAGLNAAGVIDGLLRGSVRAVLSLGGNFGVAAPDSPRVLAALSRCRLTVHIATKLNRTHCHPGEVGLLLPTLGRTDIDTRQGAVQFITTEDSMSVVRRSRGLQAPIDANNQVSEPAIVAHIGEQIARTKSGLNTPGQGSGIPWRQLADDYQHIRDLIEQGQRGVTAGFEQFNQRLSRDGRLQLPNKAAQRQFATTSGKAEFRVHALPTDSAVHTARARHGDAVLTLMTLRSHDQFNTTVYSQDDRYRGVTGGRRVLFINAEDLRSRGLQAGDEVDIEALHDDGISRRAHRFKTIAYDIPVGCIAAYFPEASALLATGVHSQQTQTPSYKNIPVRIGPAQGQM